MERRVVAMGLSIPAAHSPIADTTGKDCTQQQSGPIFYLAGTSGGGAVTRKCAVLELSPNLGDGLRVRRRRFGFEGTPGLAATSIPSVNLTP